MQWELVVALVIALPIILFPFPVAYVWYLNIGGIVVAVRDARARRIACEEGAKVTVQGK